MVKINGDKKIVLFVLSLAVLITACVKNSNTPVITPGVTSITGYIKNANNLSILDSAMSKAGLLPTFDSVSPASSTAPYTFFAPLDVSFQSAGIFDSTIGKYTKDSLLKLVGYHIFSPYAKTVAQLPVGPNARMISITGDSIFVTVRGGIAYVNGVPVIQNDVLAGNGIIQGLGGVLIPSYGRNIYQLLKNISQTSDTTLSFLVAALDRASQSTVYGNIDSLLSNGGVLSFFAPSNSAFQAMGDSTIAMINSLNVDTLARRLMYHILPGRVFSTDFPQSGSLVTMLSNTDSLNFSTLAGLTVTGKGDSSNASNIVTPNRVATNGVIHKIDRFLLP
ncbi:MAG: fasciclin domain-containing protein [Bacteroidetes bacterium]|nr:fasciclin domain-containing protein [Bacteroidota bacterium]